MTTPSRSGLSRRKFLQTTGAGLAASTLSAPYLRAQEATTLRYLGTAVNQHQAIADRVMEDLGITLEFIPVTTDEVTKRAVTQPNTFDILDIEYASVKKVVPSGNLMGMDVNRIDLADQITPLFTVGEIEGEAVGDQGTAPKKVQFLTGAESTEFADAPTDFMTLIPTVYNADTLGIRPDLIGRPIESWAELLNPEFAGKASILNIPSIGIMDAALALEATGAVQYVDKGNMTREEIDQTVAALIEAKRNGQFRALWTDFNESVNMMASGEVVIQSMWSPAITAVRSQGVPCVYQPLKEGYRAWAAGFGLPATLENQKVDAAYEFVNWFLSGWAGAFLNRQGYYSAVVGTAKDYMEPYEWAYWIEGEPAEQDILAPDGSLLEQAGAVRDGGSYWERMGSISCWNAVMDENTYMVRKWNEFVAA
jgi:putative spermidine/putrescine transport system substrate-binding protein